MLVFAYVFLFACDQCTYLRVCVCVCVFHDAICGCGASLCRSFCLSVCVWMKADWFTRDRAVFGFFIIFFKILCVCVILRRFVLLIWTCSLMDTMWMFIDLNRHTYALGKNYFFVHKAKKLACLVEKKMRLKMYDLK